MADTGTEKKQGAQRLLFIDNIRILLICLVITTHSAITYGGLGSWYYVDTTGNGTMAPFILSLICIVNQSFFMGFFLLISAYFVPSSIGRKGTAAFVRDRLVRLGIPLVVWIVLMNALIILIIRLGTGTLPDGWESIFDPVTGHALGPMWFVFLLLIATLLYVAWVTIRPPGPPRDQQSSAFPEVIPIVALGLLLGLVTAVVRIFLPIGSFSFFNFQPPFFPQYIAFFIIGIWAARNNWFDKIPSRTGKICAVAATILIAILPAFYLLTIGSGEGISLIRGGLHWQAFLFAFWEMMAGVMIIVGLLWMFSRWFKNQGPVTRAMAGDSYTVYIIHPVIIISLALVLTGIALPPIAKFAIELPLAICCAFVLAHLIRAVPGVKRVL
ncbi:acyltransferase family protein [uncultured Methanoregula sp.]|uniref:acyltransferase family protein n=1 Tax=uncultured Methanoregula sp. TaxID=1005933 RepID=UPI002AAB2A91|nr:acyltransferase family protein [uncultured Methanoregula sp.]